MCGIAGLMAFAPARAPVEPVLLQAMNDAIAHRGPDGDGLWISDDRRIGLAHRRLSIIDLSTAANQPMVSADGRYVIVFNGEIYNHAALRLELVELGHRTWTTDHSDTEVILEAFKEWGTACLDRLRGMFAFALWDKREQALWLVRDRVGIKPLYVALDGNGVAFASEIKAILADRRRKRAVDEESLFHFLSFITTPAPRTLFQGIAKLPAGSWMRIDAEGRVTERRWWDAIEAAGAPLDLADGEAAEAVLATLRDAVSIHKVADVPQGVFLSGGIDSSTNLKLFAEGATEAPRSFAIGYDGAHGSVADELPYARLMADAVGARHAEMRLTQDDLLGFLPEMVRLQDEPIADPVCVPVYFVSRMARHGGVTVAHVGEGADELFLGYPGWQALDRLEGWNRLPMPNLLRRLGVCALEAAGRGGHMSTELLRRASAGQPLFWGGAEAFPETVKRQLLSPRLRKTFAGLSSWDVLAPIRRRFDETAIQRSPLDWMTYLDLNLRLPELLLMRVDKMSMGVALEARVPFLDHEVIRLAMQLPATQRMRGGVLKGLLKRAVAGLLPEKILNRPKQGFGVPVREWFDDRLGAEARARLDRFCARTDFLDRKAVGDLMAAGRGPQVWYLFNLAMWWETYVAD